MWVCVAKGALVTAARVHSLRRTMLIRRSALHHEQLEGIPEQEADHDQPADEPGAISRDKKTEGLRTRISKTKVHLMILRVRCLRSRSDDTPAGTCSTGCEGAGATRCCGIAGGGGMTGRGRGRRHAIQRRLSNDLALGRACRFQTISFARWLRAGRTKHSRYNREFFRSSCCSKQRLELSAAAVCTR